MCSRLLYPIDAMPFDTTDSRGMCDVTAARAGATLLLSSELAIESREAQRNNISRTDFAIIRGNGVIPLTRRDEPSRAKT